MVQVLIWLLKLDNDFLFLIVSETSTHILGARKKHESHLNQVTSHKLTERQEHPATLFWSFICLYKTDGMLSFFMEHQSLVFTHFKCLLKTLHTLSAFWIMLSLSSFPLVNSQSVLRKLCMFISDIFYQWNHLTHISAADVSFFMIPSRSRKFFPPHHQRMAPPTNYGQSQMVDVAKAYRTSHARSTSLKWH